MQRYDAIDGNPIGEEYQTGGYKMPADAGIYRIQSVTRSELEDPELGAVNFTGFPTLTPLI